MTVQPNAKNGTIVSLFIWTKHRNLTDRRRHGRTDRQTAITAVCIASNADAM